jgi:hypothetical protein
MSNVGLLQKALSSFRKADVTPSKPPRPAEAAERSDMHRSKRARIKDVLRRYEHGGITEAEAVEELLAMMR